ncbi:MAG: ParB/RepB/Spo0J family partition protein [Nitrospirota bacterium]|nr:ParB/RepB/Spo0J family partition protein [Nitrospirota bacterium]
MTTRQALGKGLDALLGNLDRASASLRDIPLEQIVPNPYQPRTVFDDTELQGLADSIARQGVLQPVTVRQSGTGYELISGERRWRAARMAGLATVPALVRAGDNLEALELALVENLQRADLNPMESAQAYQRMLVEFGLTQEQVASRVGKERSSVANAVRLLNLPLEVQDHVQAGRISVGHAKVILSAPGADAQCALAKRVIDEQLSVRQLEAVCSGSATPAAIPALAPATGRHPAPLPSRGGAATTDLGLQTDLARRLGVRVTVRDGKRSGRIEIRYSGPEERARLVALLLGA